MFEELLDLYKIKIAEIDNERKEAQAMVTLIVAIEKMSGELTSKHTEMDLIGKLIDQVDRLSKDVADLKSQFRARQGRASSTHDQIGNEGKALDNHARGLIDIMAERPSRYTTSELVDMLGLNKTTVISVMKRALELDPKHVKMSQGKRRKLYLSYVPDEEIKIGETNQNPNDTDRAKLELMAMT
ncbi:MAG: hypothetical protein MUO26_00695 [Methanotrichaceae archaeon]|nr:hypothetical protein [Methanotrichaceae archaeon]